MAVKVVSKAPVKTKQCTCNKCGYRLEYTGVDVESYVSHDYGGGSDTYYCIHCPNCGATTNVERWSLWARTFRSTAPGSE